MFPSSGPLDCSRADILFCALLKFRYTGDEIEGKVEELRNFLSEQAGIASKDNKEGKSTYVQLVDQCARVLLFGTGRF